jgi:phosphate transport system substrate-binding protein
VVTTRRGARIRAFRRIAVGGAALCVLVTTLGVPGSAAPKLGTNRQVVVTPSTGLGDQVVSVSWSGFRPTTPDGNYTVDVLQCTAQPHDLLRDCNIDDTFPFSLTGNRQTANTAKDGTGNVLMDIMSTSRLPSLGCSQTHACSLLVFEDTFDGYDPTHLPPFHVIVPLRFQRSFADCPPVQTFDFRMETESSAAPALYRWAAHFCTGAHAFNVDVTNSSSNSARENFFSNQVDIAVSSLPPEPGEMTATSPQYTAVPLDLTAVVFAYNITDPQTHKPITDLTLTPRLVARLISDTDLTSFFRDPEFLKLNPHHHWPIQIAAPGLRAEKNADTWIVTNWLNGDASARNLLDGHDKYGVPVNPAWKGVQYPTDIFEARLPDGVYFPRIGEEGVAQRLFADTKPAESIPTNAFNAGFIGVLDLPTATRFHLPVARLTEGVGKPVVTLGLTSVFDGYRALQTSGGGFHTEPAAPGNPGAYPLMKVDSAMVPPKLTNSPRDLRIRAFLDYAVTDGQQNIPSGYATLPKALQLQTLNYTGDQFLANTTTTTTTTTTPGGGNGTGSYNGGGGYTGNGYSDGSYSGSDGGYTGDTTPTASPSGASGAKGGGKATTTTKPSVAKLAGLRLPDSGDHLVLPVVLVLAAVALLVRGVEAARHRVRFRRTAR